MTFRVESIELNSFRNWERLELELGDSLTVIHGPNAVGKTNLIEAIQLLTAAESFRHPQWAELIRWGAEAGGTRLTASGEGRRRDVELSIDSTGRTYRVNGAVKRKLSEVSGIIPAVLFTPDDLRMVKGAAQRRREGIDEIGEQLSTTYRDIRGGYEKALRQRNALLRDEQPDRDLLEAWTERLVELGAALGVHRMRLFERIQKGISSVYAQVSPVEELRARYESAWWSEAMRPEDRGQSEKALRGALDRRASDERKRRTTLAGPHKDDIVFEIDGHDARTFASQGQQRSVALAWKLAEVGVVEAIAQREPILLLDDVMSELDESRRDSFARAVLGRVQTVITTTNMSYFTEELAASAKVVALSGA